MQETPTGRRIGPPRWNRWLVAAGGVVVLAAVVTAAAVLFGGNDDDSAGRLDRRTVIIEDQFAAYNDGDLARWVGFFAVGGTFYGERVNPESLPDFVQTYRAADDRLTLTGPCEELTEARVSCPFLREDAFHGAGGVRHEGVMGFRFNDADEIVAVTEFDLNYGTYANFDIRFRNWLERAHPDVRAAFGPMIFQAMPNATDMTVALQYVDEFVAQSDDYPVADVP